jgi:NitT/TauT family transport system substrate-binding protein
MKSQKRIYNCSLPTAVFLVTIAFVPLLPKIAPAADKIRIFYSAITGEQSAFYVVKESGMLQKYGLDPEMVYLDSGTIAVQAMLSGEIQLGLLGSTAAISSSLRGSDVKIIAGMINQLTYVLTSDPKITRPQQLKGGKIAIARFGSLSDFGVRLALKRLGVPLSEVTLMQLGGGQTARFAALKSGVVQAAIFAPPMTRIAREQGFFPMLDMIKEKFDYSGSAIAASGSLLRDKPELVARFMKGYVAGIHYAKTHKEESMRITARYMNLDMNKDRASLEETYNIFIQDVVQRKPYPTVEGIQRVLEQIAETDAKARSSRPEQFVDTRVLAELDQSGFIDALYR